MGSSKFDPQSFFRQVESVALHVPVSEIFGLFRRTLDLPGSWAALVTKKSGDSNVVRAGGVVEAAEGEDVLFVRVTPVEAVVEEDNVSTRDGFQCRVDVRLRVRLNPERGELLAFRKAVLGSHRVVQAAGIGRYLQPAVRTALARLAAEQDAASLVNGSSSDAVSALMAGAIEGSCFEAGMILEDRPIATFQSPTLRQVQQTRQQAARRRAEHDANRQLEKAIERAQSHHLDHLTSLLTRLKESASASPEVELPELMRTFGEHQRGELYEALFASETPASRTQWIVVAAGDELLFFDPIAPDAPVRRLKVTGEAGPVRSAQMVDMADVGPVLLLGAATGVYRWPIDRAEPDRIWRVPGAPSVRGGFNAVAAAGDRVFATHSELGLWEWNVDDATPARRRFESVTAGAKTVRHVHFFEGSLYFSTDDRVIRFLASDSEDRPTSIHTGSSATITALCVISGGLFAGNSKGKILHWSKGRDSAPELLHHGSHRAAESIGQWSSHGVRRLVFTDTSLHVFARVLGDSFVCRYEAGGQTLRRVEIAPDLLVATNDLRDRLICWAPGQPSQPTSTIGVSRLCGQSVQDVCLVPRA